jgi:hypothetical protein
VAALNRLQMPDVVVWSIRLPQIPMPPRNDVNGRSIRVGSLEITYTKWDKVIDLQFCWSSPRFFYRSISMQ